VQVLSWCPARSSSESLIYSDLIEVLRISGLPDLGSIKNSPNHPTASTLATVIDVMVRGDDHPI
jgi:hypothetical protein